MNGRTLVKKFMPGIRAVHGQPDRWTISGGVSLDLTPEDAGLPQGDLTDNEIAVKVAREFFEALIAKDFERAGSIYSGIPASRIEGALGKIEFLRIVSVGDPTPHPEPWTKFLQVPCEVEIRLNGQTHVKEFMPNIRAVYNQPDRWAIGGGI